MSVTPLFIHAGASAVQRKVVATRRTPAASPRLTAQKYRQEVASITSCASYREKAGGLSDPLPLIEAAAATGALNKKTEYESTAVAQDRIRSSADRLIGDAGKISLSVNIGDNATYDADAGVMTVLFRPGSRVYFPAMVGLRSKKVPTGSYVGHTVFGSSRTVKKENFETVLADLRFKASDVPNKVTFPMEPTRALLFKKALGTLQVLGSIDSIRLDGGRHSPTIDDPVDRMAKLIDITFTPKCAFILDVTEPVGDWLYDRWDD